MSSNTSILRADGLPHYKSDTYYHVHYFLNETTSRKTIVKALSVDHAIGAICVAYPESFIVSCEPFTIH